MQLVAGEPMEYLGGDLVIEVDHPAVRALAGELRAAHPDDVDVMRAAYEWVRDRIRHSVDAQDPRITVTAGEVLSAGVGLCYAKSHLLVAVARAAGVPAGLCYQQLTDGGEPFLHGLVAVYLAGRWHRQDPRGNRAGIDAQFRLGREQLAYPITDGAVGLDFPEVHVRPSPNVIAALRGARDALELCRAGLPATP
ncbi:transglutaminase family protein [Micromonospora sp. WMMD1155]|uniref:transglutaminase-like domain-containing protein n=1 Tax=Micromonospora sp. WMMD1155 TaxID=3016094 RepID=UPI00249B311D|nr:transglutaminase family protein [Micromonospora sp. WMMD1155]WFE54858.1 transglutaminase family protein [Micromonospora sp. WMMD1155]